MIRKDGVQIFIGVRVDHIDVQWWLYDCTYLLPPHDGDELPGYIEGDGHLWEMDSLVDDMGHPITTCDSLDDSIGRLPIETLRHHYRTLLMDSTEDDTAIRTAASRVLTDYEVNGDSYGVPALVDIVERLVQEIERLRKATT